MARTRSGQDLINDAYARSDLESAEDRHERPDVLRYVNQGCAALYDLLIEARGRTFYRSQKLITTLSETTAYALDADFYRLLSVRVAGSSDYALEPFTSGDEPYLRSSSGSVSTPTHYELRPGAIELLPFHMAGTEVVVDYIPACPDLLDDPASLFDGINGWEEYIVLFAAKCMAMKDQDWDLVRELRVEMGQVENRISKLAPTRDAFRAERVRNVRTGRFRSY
jgi:hypothetical protein